MQRSRSTLAARYVFPVEGPPIEQGRVTLEDSRIQWVGPDDGREVDLDLGNVAIVPGFVNAHTHLELSPIAPVSTGIEDEIDWLRRVISQRMEGTREDLQKTVERNLQSSLQAGTTLLADITTAGLSWDAIAAAPLRATVFAEILGLNRMRGLQTSQDAWDWISSIQPLDQVSACARIGIEPPCAL